MFRVSVYRRGEEKVASIAVVYRGFDACIFGRFVYKIECTYITSILNAYKFRAYERARTTD